MTITAHAPLVCDRTGKCLPKRDAHIFNRVVGVNLEIALGHDIQINQAMTRNLVQHVIQKRYARRQRFLPSAIQVEGNPNSGFGGIAGDFSGSHGVGRS